MSIYYGQYTNREIGYVIVLYSVSGRDEYVNWAHGLDWLEHNRPLYKGIFDQDELDDSLANSPSESYKQLYKRSK